MSGHPVPAALAKKGICSVSDNLPEGASLDIGRLFAQMFRPELEARLLRHAKVKSCQDSTSCRSGK